MVRYLLAVVMVVALASSVTAATSFYDDFENGVGGDIVYAPWGNAPGNPASPNGNNNLVATATNEHSVSGNHSARAFASDPAAWNGYVDFGATASAVSAEVWLFEDKSNPGTVNPVTNMLALIGAAPNPTAFTDYLQLGVVSFWPSGSTGYGYRTPAGMYNASVSRKAGWTNLAIYADSLASGGQVRFYIDGTLVGTKSRASGVSLQYVRIGNNSKSYENFWYDDLRVTVPEPASLLGLLGGCGMFLVGFRLRRR